MIKKEDKILLLVSELKPTGESISQINFLLQENINWKCFTEHSINNNLASIVYKNFSNLPLSKPPDIYFQKLKNYYFKTLSRNIKFYEEFNIIISAFKQNKIDVIPLKGIVLADLIYKDIGLRHMSDIDLLVKPDQIYIAVYSHV